MNIIEREIEKRLAIINGLDAKKEELNNLNAKVIELQNEIASVNVDILKAEIEELKGFLPKLEAPVEEAPAPEIEAN